MRQVNGNTCSIAEVHRQAAAARVQKADVRMIAASNRDLEEAVSRGAFREDLPYRLQVFDILQFLVDSACHLQRATARLTVHALEALLAHDWPGNVRELRNVIERATILSDGDIEPHHLSLRSRIRPAAPPTDRGMVEKSTIERIMQQTGWNKSQAARPLGPTRTQLYGRLRRYGVEAPPVDVALV